MILSSNAVVTYALWERMLTGSFAKAIRFSSRRLTINTIAFAVYAESSINCERGNAAARVVIIPSMASPDGESNGVG